MERSGRMLRRSLRAVGGDALGTPAAGSSAGREARRFCPRRPYPSSSWLAITARRARRGPRVTPIRLRDRVATARSMSSGTIRRSTIAAAPAPGSPDSSRPASPSASTAICTPRAQWSLAVQGAVRGIRYYCVAADAVGFRPLRVDSRGPIDGAWPHATLPRSCDA